MREQAEAARNDEARQRTLAELARNDEAKQRSLAEAEEKKAKTSAAKSEQAFKFMAGMLTGVGPSVAAGRDATLLREILDKTVKRLDKDLKDKPEVEENIRGMLGMVYLDLGDLAKAEAMARESMAIAERLFGRDHEDVAGALRLLGQVLMLEGQGPESETLSREALAILRRLPTTKDIAMAAALVNLGTVLASQGKLAEAETNTREALTLLKKHPEDETILLDQLLMLLGGVLQRQGRLAEAEPMLRETLTAQKARLGDSHPTVGTSLLLLSNVLMAQGRLPEAESMLREAFAVIKKSYGPESQYMAMLLPTLALNLQMQGRLPEAEATLREALALATKVLGKDHPMIGNIRRGLAQVLQQQNKTAEAEAVQKAGAAASSPAKAPGTEELMAAEKQTQVAMTAMQQRKFAEVEKNLSEALPVLEKGLGGAHQGVIGTRMLLSQALIQLGKFTEAEAVARDQLLFVRKSYGDKSVLVANTLFVLAMTTQLQGKLVEAEAALREALAISKLQTTDGENANVAAALLQLASVKAGQGASKMEAEMLRNQAAEITRKLPASVSGFVATACLQINDLLMKYDRPAQAEPIDRVLVAFTRQFLGSETEELAWKLTSLTWVLNKNGKYEEGEAAAREAVAIRKKLLPRDDWRISHAEYEVGESLVGQKKYPEAESLLLAVFTNLKKRGPEKADPQSGFWREQFTHTAELLTKLYTETNQPAKAAEWKKKAEESAAADKPPPLRPK